MRVGAPQVAGCLQVRVRRDANEQAVLAQVTGKLSRHIPPELLAVQVVKDDWAPTRGGGDDTRQYHGGGTA